ncbi:hypothetical protein [uncultured Brevundimonas sp.]|uniref:hypothetical protein n=1 Tax=uncultured Brevundimonas sp. TaxID=213418 RepID=UPI0025EFD0BA|nr:hypothetical protein [uncultured Brevundimonas sp.]
MTIIMIDPNMVLSSTMSTMSPPLFWANEVLFGGAVSSAAVGWCCGLETLSG